jgi:hypothetical protein
MLEASATHLVPPLARAAAAGPARPAEYQQIVPPGSRMFIGALDD